MRNTGKIRILYLPTTPGFRLSAFTEPGYTGTPLEAWQLLSVAVNFVVVYWDQLQIKEQKQFYFPEFHSASSSLKTRVHSFFESCLNIVFVEQFLQLCVSSGNFDLQLSVSAILCVYE